MRNAYFVGCGFKVHCAITVKIWCINIVHWSIHSTAHPCIPAPTCQYIRLSIYPFDHPSMHLSILYAFIYPFDHPSTHSPIWSSIHPANPSMYPLSIFHPPIYPFYHPSIHLSTHPNTHPSIHPPSRYPFTCPFDHPSIHPYIHPSQILGKRNHRGLGKRNKWQFAADVKIIIESFK